MPKVTLLGAGSGFTQPLFTDILNIEGLDEGVIGLVDIDPARLEINVRLMGRLLELMGKKRWRVESSTDRRKVLKGTDYLISTIEVAGTACVRHDNDIPLKYGIDQCIGDTIGPGGVMKTLRTLPTFLEILADARQHCPNALIMNYTNPMSMMSLGVVRASQQPYVGLCHSVQGNSRQIASILGVPYDELVWKCGGINHLAWFTELLWRGHDMMPVLREAARRPDIIESFPIRSDLITNFGYFSTESCGHFSEYVPYYRKRKDLLKKHCRAGYHGGSSYYADNWPTWRKATDDRRRRMADGEDAIPLVRGHEYASDIIEAHVFDRKKVIYASVPNTGLIPNLPQTGVVEVAVLVDRRGYMPTYFGNLPEQCAAMCRANMAVFELCVDGVLRQDREAAIQAMIADPLSAAVCSPGEIRAMAEELFAAEKKYIPAWCAKPKTTVAMPADLRRLLEKSRRGAAVRTCRVSKLLPQQPVDKLACPKNIKALGLETRTFGEFMNRHEEFAKSGPVLAYYACRFRCSAAMRMAAFLGYDGPVKMWVDGKELFCDPHGTNPARPDAATVPFAATKGEHEALIALDSNKGSAWGIFLRFAPVDADGKQTDAKHWPEVLEAQDAEAAVSSMAARNVEKKRKRK
jgi:alpha-galactosidase